MKKYLVIILLLFLFSVSLQGEGDNGNLEPIKSFDEIIADESIIVTLTNNFENITHTLDLFPPENFYINHKISLDEPIIYFSYFLNNKEVNYYSEKNEKRIYIIQINLVKNQKNVVSYSYKREKASINFCENDFYFPFCNYNYHTNVWPLIRDGTRTLLLKIVLPSEYQLDNNSSLNYRNVKLLTPKNGSVIMKDYAELTWKLEKIPLKKFKTNSDNYELTSLLNDNYFQLGLDIHIIPKLKFKFAFIIPLLLLILISIFDNKYTIKEIELDLKKWGLPIKITGNTTKPIFSILFSYIIFFVIMGNDINFKWNLLNPLIYLINLIFTKIITNYIFYVNKGS